VVGPSESIESVQPGLIRAGQKRKLIYENTK